MPKEKITMTLSVDTVETLALCLGQRVDVIAGQASRQEVANIEQREALLMELAAIEKANNDIRAALLRSRNECWLTLLRDVMGVGR